MESTDRRGLAVSSRNATALEHYEAALELTASYFVDPLATITAAIEHEPTCAIAHCLRAALGVMSSERGALPMIRESVESHRGARHARQRSRTCACRRGPRLARGRLCPQRAVVRRDRRRASPRPARRADGAHRRFRAGAVDVPARPDCAGAAALEHGRARLRLRARHARVRPRGDRALRTGRGHGPTRARTEPPRPVGGARRRARDGNAGPHRRWHRMADVACAGLVDRQRTRVPQLVAPRAAPPRVRRARARAGDLRHAHPAGAELGRTRDGRCLRDALAAVLARRRRGYALAAARCGLGAARRGRLLRVQRRARDVRTRRRGRPRRRAARDRKPRARRRRARAPTR